MYLAPLASPSAIPDLFRNSPEHSSSETATQSHEQHLHPETSKSNSRRPALHLQNFSIFGTLQALKMSSNKDSTFAPSWRCAARLDRPCRRQVPVEGAVCPFCMYDGHIGAAYPKNGAARETAKKRSRAMLRE
jgi:hypothetical protein